MVDNDGGISKAYRRRWCIRKTLSIGVSEEPSNKETLEILRGIKAQYEAFHDVIITDQALEEAVFLSTRYITDRQLPDKAVDVLDEAASKVMLRVSSAPPN